MSSPGIVIESEDDGSISYVRDRNVGYNFQGDEIDAKWIEDIPNFQEKFERAESLEKFVKNGIESYEYVWLDGQPFVLLDDGVLVAVGSEHDNLKSGLYQIDEMLGLIRRHDRQNFSSDYWDTGLAEKLSGEDLDRDQVLDFVKENFDYVLDFNEIDFQDYREKDWTVLDKSDPEVKTQGYTVESTENRS